jgi:V/A-type H+-transporting ATPase subunit F
VEYHFIGEAELVTAFRFIGVEGTAVNDSGEAVAAFKKITEEPENCHILIITEKVALWLGDLMINWQLSDRYPLIVEIPGLDGKLEGRKTLVESIREAIGINV